MQLDEARSALHLTDPPERPAADNDALLARILATPLETQATASPTRRRWSRRLALIAAAGTLVVAVTAGWAYQTLIVDSKGLVPYLQQARDGVPLPPGANWSPIRDDTLPPNSNANGPEFARDAALLEAQCHWERFIVDSSDSAAGIAGLRDIATLMGENAGTAAVANGYADRAARGDLGGVEQDLEVNCPPAMGGTATPLHLLALSLQQAGTPAVAVVLTYPDMRYASDDEQERVSAVARRVRVELNAAGLSSEPDEDGTGFWIAGHGIIITQFHVHDPDAAATTVTRAFAGLTPQAGSYVLIWRTPDEQRTIPLG